MYILICLSIYDRISLTNRKITHVFNFLLGFAENQRILRFEIVFGSDNGDLDSRVQIMVLLYALLMRRFIINFVIIWMVYTFTDDAQAPYIQLSDIKKQYLID